VDEMVVCRCEQVTWADIMTAMRDLQPTSLRQLKLVTRWGMGACQGRVCRPLGLAVGLGEGKEGESGLRGRPPLRPVSLGALMEEDSDSWAD